MDLGDIAGYNNNDPNDPPYPLPYQVTLIQASVDHKTYLIDFYNLDDRPKTWRLVKRLIRSGEDFAKYHFNPSTIEYVHQLIADAIYPQPRTFGKDKVLCRGDEDGDVLCLGCLIPRIA